MIRQLEQEESLKQILDYTYLWHLLTFCCLVENDLLRFLLLNITTHKELATLFYHESYSINWTKVTLYTTDDLNIGADYVTMELICSWYASSIFFVFYRQLTTWADAASP